MSTRWPASRIVPRPCVRTWRGTSCIGVEEAGVVLARLPRQGLDPGARRQRRTGLVEPEVAIGADAEQLDVDAAGIVDRRLVAGGLRGDVLRLAVGAVDPVQSDLVGELAADDRVIGLRVSTGESDVLVEQERPALGQAERARLGGGASAPGRPAAATSPLPVRAQRPGVRDETTMSATRTPAASGSGTITTSTNRPPRLPRPAARPQCPGRMSSRQPPYAFGDAGQASERGALVAAELRQDGFAQRRSRGDDTAGHQDAGDVDAVGQQADGLRDPGRQLVADPCGVKVAGVGGVEQLGGGAVPLSAQAAAGRIQLEAAAAPARAERPGRVVHEVPDLSGHAARAVPQAAVEQESGGESGADVEQCEVVDVRSLLPEPLQPAERRGLDVVLDGDRYAAGSCGDAAARSRGSPSRPRLTAWVTAPSWTMPGTPSPMLTTSASAGRADRKAATMSSAPATTPSAPLRVGCVTCVDDHLVRLVARSRQCREPSCRRCRARAGSSSRHLASSSPSASVSTVAEPYVRTTRSWRRAPDRASRARPGRVADCRRAGAGSSPRPPGRRWPGARRWRPRRRATSLPAISPASGRSCSPPRSSRPQDVSPTARLVPVSMRTTVAGPVNRGRRRRSAVATSVAACRAVVDDGRPRRRRA